jgi:hypothetical protein
MSHSLLKLIGSNQVFFDQDFAKPGRHERAPGAEFASNWKVTEGNPGSQRRFAYRIESANS